MAGKNIYDISPEARELKEWKVAKRLELRNEYLREIQDPKRMEPVMDPGLQRFYATRVQLEKLYIPTVRNVLPCFLIFALMWGSAEILNMRREKREHLYRTGQVSYVDRLFKFK